MNNRDRLEGFIKREVSRIEFDDADAMWQEFQGQLEKEKPQSKVGLWYWPGVLFAFLLIAFGVFYQAHIYDPTRMPAKKNSSAIVVTNDK